MALFRWTRTMRYIPQILLLLAHVNDCISAGEFYLSASDTDSLFGLNHERDIGGRHRRNAVSKPNIDSMAVVSIVRSHYAKTVITSVITNSDNVSKEAKFEVQIPNDAFISNFTMVINGVFYVGQVMEKKAAEKKYEEAKKANKTAGKVSSEEKPTTTQRNMEKFSVSVNVAKNSSALFELTYQQLLVRRLGVYTQFISVRPNQLVDNLSVQVYIFEPQGIRISEYKEPTGKYNNDVTTRTVSANEKHFIYSPSTTRQKEMDPSKGIAGDFVVLYDVDHGYDAGEIRTDSGYFVHYFSPNKLTPLGKNVVFVLDNSGSMGGEKINQTRYAMATIIRQLRTQDNFMVLIFDNNIIYWPEKGAVVPATTSNIQSGVNYAMEKLTAAGSTNINSALVTAARTLSSFGGSGVPIIVFLTDGHPSSGETNPDKIVKNVIDELQQKIAIYSLGFGANTNFELLQRLAYGSNGGFARRIYTGEDATEQLQKFFEEVSSPLMSNIKITYDSSAVDIADITQNTFPQYFNGSELVIAGKLKQNSPTKWNVKVVGISTTGSTTLTKEVDTSTVMSIPAQIRSGLPDGFLEKLWAYQKIKELLKKKLMTDDVQEQKRLEGMALNMSLVYKFVTPLTSIVITQRDPQQNAELNMADSKMCSSCIRNSIAGGGFGHAPVYEPSCVIVFGILLLRTFLE